jgi:hypothetical protein
MGTALVCFAVDRFGARRRGRRQAVVAGLNSTASAQIGRPSSVRNSTPETGRPVARSTSSDPQGAPSGKQAMPHCRSATSTGNRPRRVGQGLTQLALINTVIGGSRIGADDAGSAVGLFLTTAQSCIAFGVAALGGRFFASLGTEPQLADYLAAVSMTLWCSLLLLIAAVASRLTAELARPSSRSNLIVKHLS